MSDLSARLSLPYLQAAQAQKHVTHNEALERLDLLVQLTVQAFDATTPPTSADEGQIWALGAAPSGDWAMHPHALAAWSNGGWLFITPQAGWRASLGGELRVWTGAGWEVPAPALDNLPGLGINASHDATNRLVVAADAALFTHDGEGHQLKINKAGIGDTGSLLFQTGFSGRAEMGLAGEDDFSFKVSADGSAWLSAISIDAGSGDVQMPQSLAVSGVITGNVAGNVTGNVTGNVSGNVSGGLTGGPIENAPIGTDTPASGAFTVLSAASFLGLPAEDIIEAVIEAMERRLGQIFRLGEEGTLASDPLHSFTDTAGTTAADWGDSIARVDDQSGNARNALQASAALRPLLGRAPVDAAPGGAVDQGSGPAFIRFDLSDDVLTTEFPDGGTFDVMVFGRQGSWIERDVVIAPAGSLNIGPRSFTGAVAGVLPALGDIVGWTAVDRTLTETEVSRLVRYHRGRGAKGLLVPGPELLANGTFDTDLTGWTVAAGVMSHDAVNQRMDLLKDISGGSNVRSGASIGPVAEGTPFLFSFDTGGDAAFFFRLAATPEGGPLAQLTNQTQGVFVAPVNLADGHAVVIGPNTEGQQRWFDNVSVRELRPQEDW